MKVSFEDQELAVEIPTDILDKYHDEYQARQNKYFGCAKYERAARIAQRFLKRHLRALTRFNDEEALLQDRMEALLDVQNIELETVQGYKVERLAELDQEWKRN
ncbi:expressed unknown protein [Seminavis robusta]|uniref:Uncharacterized protein n=1 Tax=Seminavis robusta TaxID=568900 RepID=A0A9N8DRQ8_9STRA|nr:expressed unknown protein [Seminavis robusta]|eukprot:Sro293_g109990.1 n/a (104) ;mRNA; r:51985-52296